MARVADGGRAMKCLRIYADERGESHLAEADLPLTPVEVFPGTTLRVSAPHRAASIRFVVKPRGLRVAHWHTAPERQLVVWLSGWFEIEASDGDVRRLPPGAVVLAEDTWGKGHISRHPEEEQQMVFVSLPEGT
jgi:hypothetical protein